MGISWVSGFGSLNVTDFRGIKQCKCMVNLKDFPENSAFFLVGNITTPVSGCCLVLGDVLNDGQDELVGGGGVEHLASLDSLVFVGRSNAVFFICVHRISDKLNSWF